MTLRSYLVALTLAVVVPLALFAIGLVALLVDGERETFSRGAQERTRAVLTALDSELKSPITTISALASSRALDTGDLRRFRDEAARILKTEVDWANINLALPDGQQVMNLSVPEGAPLPNIAALDGSFERLLRSGKPVISDLAIGPVLKRWSFAVRVPVIRDGTMKYVLSAGVNTAGIQALLTAQNLPPDWLGAVYDRNHRIVARTVEHEKSLGELAVPGLLARLQQTSSFGWFRGRTLEDAAVYTPYARSEATGWSVAIAIPAAEVNRNAWRAAALLLPGLVAALTLAIVLARLISRRISRPIAALAAATEAIGRGAAVTVPDPSSATEIRSLAAALRTAAEAMRERQQLLEREKEALRAADRAKDEFLAMLSHELRNPLAALTTAAHVLKLANPNEAPSIKSRAVIERQSRHMARLIEDLLDVSRVAMGKATLEREALNLADVVANVVQLWRSAERLAGHELALNVAPVWVEADRTRIEQIVSNLLDNALKFTPAGKRVSVEVRRERDEALLQVSDEGEGLAPETIGRVFDLFVQGTHDLARSRGGLGIGLALVKRLAEMHGGSVAAASAGPGRGAVFTVRLPATDAAARAAPQPAARPEAARRILIVEDTDDARQMLRAALALSGHDVTEACDGASAVAAAIAMRPDVALIDIGLPDFDGYELAKRLRSLKADRRMTLIALTGYGQPDDKRRALEAGFDAHLTKPVEPEQLKQAIAAFH